MDEKMITKILFVEDVPTDAELAARELRKGGLEFTSLRVDTEETFTAALDSFRPDIVVSDYSMPAFDGMKALAIARERSDILPFIVLTGALNEETAVACMKAGANDYVLKERMARLSFAVREALSKREVQEVSERRRAQLEESERCYRSLFDDCNAVMCLMDPRTLSIVDVNKAGCGFYGWPKEELLGKRVLELCSLPEDSQLSEIARAISDPSAHLVFKQRGSDGSERDVETYNGRIVMDGKPFVLSIVHDVTDRVVAERDLSLKSAALEAAANAIVILDREGRIEWLNAAFEPLSGYSRSESLGRPCCDLIQSRKAEQAYNDLWETILSGKPWKGELENIRKSGEEYVEEMTITPVLGKDGKTEHFIAIMKDITEQIAARKRLEASLHEKSVLLREIHHRVKNNMQIITSLMHLALDDEAGQYCAEVISDITRRIESMAIIHDQFYESSDAARIDFSGYLDQLIMEARDRYPAGARGLSIECDAEEAFLDLGSAIPAGLLVSELIENALRMLSREAAGDGSVLRVEQRVSGGSTLEIAIRDEGIRLPGGLDYRQSGAFSLELMRILSEQLNGSLSFDDVPGAAAALRFPLPSR